eukprot:3143221-Amphidinium_carterae.1
MLSGISAHGSYNSGELQAACSVMLSVLDSGDRLVPVSSDGPAAWVYTDASAESADPAINSQEVLIGGILYARGTTRPLSYFSERVPDFIVKHWAAVRKQVTAQAELFAALVSKWLWRTELLSM